MITVTINGKEIRLEKPVTVLEAARSAGIQIPTLCHYPGLEAFGGCRLCLVEVEKMPKLQTSCTVMTTDGMKVRTESEEIAKARRAMIEFLLINHPLDCPFCDKAGECTLQDLTLQYGAAAGRFAEGKRKHPESFDDPLIVRNMERCILCTRCVRMCDGVQGASAITVTGRGNHSFVEPFSGGRYSCEYCGNCLTVCPVGAIMSRLHRHAYRPWQMEEEVTTVCSFCGVGCSMVVQVRENRIVRTVPRPEIGINRGILCAKGRFGYGYIESAERIATPLIRKDGRLQHATWEEAISFTAKRLREIKETSGGNAIGGIASARCTNEENYLFQKLLRAGLGTNNIDSIARTGFAVAQGYIEDVLGQGATANLLSGVPNAGGILIAGGDPVQINEVLGVQVREAYTRGSSIVTIGRMPGLSRFTSHCLEPSPYTDTTLLGALLAEVAKQKEFSGENTGFEERVRAYAAPEAGASCVPAESVARAAADLCRSASPAVVVGPEIVQRTDGRTALFLLTAISYLLNARVYLLSERPNEQGAIDMGCLPDQLPGARPVEVATFRSRVEELWAATVPADPGMSLLEMIEAAERGSLKALYVMGDNPVFNLPDRDFVAGALRKLDFLVVQDIFLSETAELADVVLPALGWAEKEGTYTNLERRIQHLRKAKEGAGMEDWRILVEVGRRLGLSMPYGGAADILAEIGAASPLHAGLTYEDLKRGLDLWPYKGEPLRRRLGAGDWQLAEPWAPEGEGRLYLCIEKHMFLSGTMSRYSTALGSIYTEPHARVSPAAAVRLGLSDNGSVTVRTSRGALHLPVRIDKQVSDNTVLLTNHFRDKGAFGLIPHRIDPVTKAPCLNGIEVTVEPGYKIFEGGAEQ